ncbi:MAG: DUF1080 domain-containing protein [Phycisphaerales bacterium JB041]
MTVRRALVCLLGLVALGATHLSAQHAPEGFQRLIPDEGLEGWWGLDTVDPRAVYALDEESFAKRRQESLEDINAHWQNVDGVLVNDGHGLFLTTDRLFGDFELFLEYRTVANADSGIYLRGIPQVQIWDTTEAGGKWEIGANFGSGGLWNNSPGAPGKDPLEHADRPFGEWNLVRVVMVGERVSVWLNGTLVVDHARLENYFDRGLPVPRTGPIQLQTHGGEVAWRNVFIREIDADEANRWLAQHADDGFTTVFNGEDFTGWSGPTDGYEVVDGALRCKPGHGGTIYTDEEYADFAVRFEFRLPPGGNNGLAIRYPGSGDTAYAGMCELQVLDNTHPNYAALEPRQYHGSIYGQYPAHRGYLRAPGEWNFQEVRVVGPRITVELNGTQILDCDTSTLTDFMYEAEKFAGQTRTRGHFGFAGHNDPVEFREVRIKRIEP